MDAARCEACNREFKDPEALAMHNSAKHNIPSKKRWFQTSRKAIFFICISAAILAGYFLVSGKVPTGTAAPLTGNALSGGVQKIELGFNSNYAPNNIIVSSGKPVEITLDSSVRGCYRSFAIPELGVYANSRNPSETIRFTPSKKGEFEFRCGMGMGRGTLVVE